MASPSTVITMGYGSFGSVNLIPTLGFGSLDFDFGHPEIFTDDTPIKMFDYLCNSTAYIRRVNSEISRILTFTSKNVQR